MTEMGTMPRCLYRDGVLDVLQLFVGQRECDKELVQRHLNELNLVGGRFLVVLVYGSADLTTSIQLIRGGGGRDSLAPSQAAAQVWKKHVVLVPSQMAWCTLMPSVRLLRGCNLVVNGVQAWD